MKYLSILIFLMLAFTKAGFGSKAEKHFTAVAIDTLLSDKINIRALLIDGNKVWYGADKSRFGYYNFITNQHWQKKFSIEEFDFRSIASNSKDIFLLNAGSPAYLYRIDKITGTGTIVYEEKDGNTFYDSMKFWNNREGIAIGDPTADCLSIIITRDGGSTWTKTDCSRLPKVEAGEAAFAASNTNIAIKDSKTWVVSGGKKSRVFYSANKGKTWSVQDSPIIQGSTMTGIFSADFHNKKTGVIAGGDYDRQSQNFGNKAITTDGGKTWQLIGENQGAGYISCVQFVPGSKGKGMATVGAGGLFYSADSGKSWKNLWKRDGLNTLRFQNDSTAIVAGHNYVFRVTFK